MLNKTIPLIAFTLAMSASVASQAQDFYGSAMVGANDQAKYSEPYGNNIAADSDFPAQFDSGDGKVGNIGLGYVFNSKFRVEARLGAHGSKFDDRKIGTGARAGEEYILNGDIKSKTFTVEGFYDIPTATSFSPYVKAGIGQSRNTYSARLGGAGVAAFDAFDGAVDGYYDAYADQKSSEFAWNIGFGATYKLNNSVNLFGEYQYMSFGKADTGQDSFTDGFQIDSEAHELMVGIRVGF